MGFPTLKRLLRSGGCVSISAGGGIGNRGKSKTVEAASCAVYTANPQPWYWMLIEIVLVF
uniref:Uncharacterized protein n=1 Tax=Oryza glumipatula TaxID=40148 RepID=A0A0E0A213_9ORYZ